MQINLQDDLDRRHDPNPPGCHIRATLLTVAFAPLAAGLLGASMAPAGDVQPRNGRWLAVMKFQSASGCSAEIRREIGDDAKDEML